MVGTVPENSGMAGNYNPTGAVGGPTASTTPSWAQQQKIPGVAGGINDMVRALLGGMAQNQQAKQYGSAIQAAQQNTAGQPLNINPPAQQAGMLTTPPNFDPTSGTGWY